MPAVIEQELGDFIEASGLLTYDPAAITRIYAGHPQRLLRRLWQTLVPIGLFLLGVGTDKVLGLLSDQKRARATTLKLPIPMQTLMHYRPSPTLAARVA